MKDATGSRSTDARDRQYNTCVEFEHYRRPFIPQQRGPHPVLTRNTYTLNGTPDPGGRKRLHRAALPFTLRVIAWRPKGLAVQYPSPPKSYTWLLRRPPFGCP